LARTRVVDLQRGYDEIFRKFAGSPTWQTLCQQVFDRYLGQYSFTQTTQIGFLVEKLNITPQSHVLELAPGTGGLSCYLAKLSGCRLTGVDASPVAVKIANRQAMLEGLSQRVIFEVGILPELPYPDCFFDAVISIDSVYGVPDKGQLFRGCCRVLKPGGYIGFYTLYERRKISAETAMHARALYWFPLKPYFILLEEAGFKDVLKVDLTKDFVRLAGRWVNAMQENREALEKELGKKTAEGLLTGDIRIAWALAIEGLIGRALFKAQKPLNG
jgi:cyclopropane fatty-acyl-phospholipid synthase-like methyltransferase